MSSRTIQGLLVLALLTVGAFGLSKQSYRAYQHNNSLKMWILDVGQGDAILFDTPDEKQILIDGGPDTSVLAQLQKALPVGDKEINIVISTHSDADHLTGINAVLEHFTVDKLIVSGATNTTKTYKTFQKLVSEKGIPTEEVKAGVSIDEGDLHGVVISPLVSVIGTQPVEQNTASVVVFWQYGNETILTEGDAQAAQEQAMLAANLVHHADILKVAHHGSATSSTENFLKMVSPKLAIISVGKNNKYNLPNLGVLERYARLQIPIIRTDERGTIEITIDKTSFSY